MSIILIDADFIVSRLNALPPHSRLRSGYCDLLREIRRREIEADVTELRQSDALGEMLADALEMALAELAEPDREAG